WLAQRYQVEVEETQLNEEQQQALQAADSLFALNQYAQQFFSQQLLETEEGKAIGLSYFEERGFSKDTIRKFQLGYNPESKDAFTKAALQQQFNPTLLLKAGLAISRYDQLQDNYHGRVIFPIHNTSGKVVGFGARILKSYEKAPKYINSPENEIYVKSKILYGSYYAKQAMDRLNECLLVEGYTDVLSLHQAGIENIVASGGTALTIDQLRSIKKYTKNLTIVYDGDQAGIKAALRGLDLALEEGLSVKLVLIPDGEDPDSYVNKVGAVAFRDFVNKNKKDVILFQLEVALQEAGADTNQKAAVVNRIAESISKINKAEDFTKQQDYIKECSTLLKIEEAGLHHLVNKFIRDRISLQEKKLTFEEAKLFEENAKQSAAAGYDDATYSLLFKDDLQEKEVARILLEYGFRPWLNDVSVAEYVFEEVDEGLLENENVKKLFQTYRNEIQNGKPPKGPQLFIHHIDQTLSAFAVSLLHFPHEESSRWRQDFSQSQGYQSSLFEKEYHEFIATLAPEKKESLLNYLQSEEDKSPEAIRSAVHYLKLRKIKRMLLENQRDLENEKNQQEINIMLQTHEHLKKVEKSLAAAVGSVIIR
ncbi:MAG: DNA primase, partial [Bacteroidetes bacterium]|nr:DNA primase [Bacteroidota bacterium]